jgi:hypothetical protein
VGTWLEALQGARDELDAAELELPGDPDPVPVRASLDPRDVQLPGVWLRFDGLAGPVLSGELGHVLVTVYCAVATTDLERSLDQVQQLQALVAPLIPPMSELRHVALALPGAGVPATALSFTHQLIID